MLNLKKITKYLIKNPSQLFKNALIDFKKDKSKKILIHNKVWCIGLPKSGTTLIENILEDLPYVEMFTSIFRKWENTNSKYMFDLNVPEKLFEDMPSEKNTFLKTHTKFSETTRKIIHNNNIKVILSVRDLRDMMISRYYHIINYKSHWQHNLIKNLSFNEGFRISLTNKKDDHKNNPLNYYYFWIKEWVEYAKKEKNILVLNYEDYLANKEKYILKILNYLRVDKKEFNFEKFKNSRTNKSLSTLSKNLEKYGRNKSTFRLGASDQWRQLFDEEMINYFNENLPDNLEKLKY